MGGFLQIVSFALFFLFLLLGCATNDLEVGTHANTEVQPTTAFPAVVRIDLPGGAGLCTGTFISPRAILTAAHCSLEVGEYRVRSSFGNFSTHHVAVLGPGLVEDPNDIALLYFDKDVADPRQGRVLPIGYSVHANDPVTLVGYGCSDLDSLEGAGIKRSGTNKIFSVSDYILLTAIPFSSSESQSRAILGRSDAAGTCFGDSGGPLLMEQNGLPRLVGVTHAGGKNYDGTILSEFCSVSRDDNNRFLHQIDDAYRLKIFDSCWGEASQANCSFEEASLGLLAFFKWIWTSIKLLISW